eukprot:3328130-Pleurochrysis_carterae.AAC.1
MQPRSARSRTGGTVRSGDAVWCSQHPRRSAALRPVRDASRPVQAQREVLPLAPAADQRPTRGVSPVPSRGSCAQPRRLVRSFVDSSVCASRCARWTCRAPDRGRPWRHERRVA